MNIQRWILLFAIAMSGVAPARAAITSIPDPSITTQIGTRIRWGGTGFEASIWDALPSLNQNPQLNPVGTPVWQLNLAYHFQISFDGATGTLTLSVDFNRDTNFGAGETITQNVFAAPDLTSYAGYGFNYLSISGNESGGSAARSQITNLVINGISLPNIAPAGTFLENFYADSPVNPMISITITGDLTFLTAGTSQERPSWNFNFKGPAQPPTPTTTTITSDDPDPSVVWQPVTVTYTVVDSSNNPVPAGCGSVTVTDGTDSCTGTAGAGSCIITLTTVGTRLLTATYTPTVGPGCNYSGSSDTEEHTVWPGGGRVPAPALQPWGLWLFALLLGGLGWVGWVRTRRTRLSK